MSCPASPGLYVRQATLLHRWQLHENQPGLYNDQGPRGVKCIYRLTFAALTYIPERTTIGL